MKREGVWEKGIGISVISRSNSNELGTSITATHSHSVVSFAVGRVKKYALLQSIERITVAKRRRVAGPARWHHCWIVFNWV